MLPTYVRVKSMEVISYPLNDPPHLQAFHHYLHDQGCGRTATEWSSSTPGTIFPDDERATSPAPALILG